jgi:Histidine kinase-, DNA gyrase B-, and HSP90-like ATPase
VSSNWKAEASITAGVYITGRKSWARRPSIQSWDITGGSFDSPGAVVIPDIGTLYFGGAAWPSPRSLSSNEPITVEEFIRWTDRSGLGLGLSIARQAVRAHGGDIHIGNMLGAGCIFAIDVPLAADYVAVVQST